MDSVSNLARRFAWVTVLVAGLIFVAGGVYAIVQGNDANDQVKETLEAQKIVTTEDASIPNTPVTDADTAEAMAEIINEHSLESTGGLTYSEMDREDPNRDTAFRSSMLQTSLYTSVLAFNVADLVVYLGIAWTAIGLGLIGVGAPTVYAVTKRDDEE